MFVLTLRKGKKFVRTAIVWMQHNLGSL